MNKAQFIKQTAYLLVLFFNSSLLAQSTFFTHGSRENHVIDRLAIRNQTDVPFVVGTVKPYQRSEVVNFVKLQDSLYKKSRIKQNFGLSDVDLYNYEKILWSNTEYLNTIPKNFLSAKKYSKIFHETKANFYEVRNKDLQLIINPAIQQVQSIEVGNKKRVYLNSKGLEVRGILTNKIGFYAYVTDNQENGPKYYALRVDSLDAVHGAGFYKPFKQRGGSNKGQDYFDYRGYVTFKLAKLTDVQFGYDKNFIGNGYRSLFLSDQSAPTLFLKMKTKVWKLDYQNLYMELSPTTLNNNGNLLLEKKYVTMHHLGINLNENVSIGLFESIVFKRKTRFDFAYMIPVIFFRAVESGLGSADNALVGADFKVNLVNSLQLYGQLMLDEFNLSELKKRSWANKIGVQGGLKYLDVGGIKNLDAQLEWNLVRPYTYSHSDSFNTYTHYNQPLAHPLGANFTELNLIARYQPTNKLYFESRFMFVYQGQDTSLKSTTTSGGNIFRTYQSRVGSINQRLVTNGIETKIYNFNILGSYELKPNLYAEANIQLRSQRSDKYAPINTAVVSLGVRWNMNRRDFDY